jgi:murein DD-endopeptidase MepM/ murein hydrolase activator NlpD
VFTGGRIARFILTANLAVVLVCSGTAGGASAAPDAPHSAHGSPSFWKLRGIGPVDPASTAPLTTSGLPEPSGMSAPQDTARLLETLSELGPRLSMNGALLRVAGPFPVAGAASWIDDWHAPRSNPYPHLHEGLDLMAAYGTPAVAVEDGTISQVDVDDSAGLTIWITDRWGTSFVYMHLSGVANGIAVGRPVRQGNVVGFVGESGNASSPHLHFEIRPGGVAIPPKPLVDRWLLIAEARARYLVRTMMTPEPASFSLRPVETTTGLAGMSRIQPANDVAVSWFSSTGSSTGLPARPATAGWPLAVVALVGSAVAGLLRLSRRRRGAAQPVTEPQEPFAFPEHPRPAILQPPVRSRPERRRVPPKPAVIGISVSLGVLLVWALRGRGRGPARQRYSVERRALASGLLSRIEPLSGVHAPRDEPQRPLFPCIAQD